MLFCDIEERTLGLDPSHLAELMDDSVRAVVPIHYSGVACDIDGIPRVLERWPRAELVEDNAHGLFGRYRGRPLGSFGRFATLSFHETKNFICGEGGALVVNREDDVRSRPRPVPQGHEPSRVPARARSTSTRGRTSDRRSGSPTCWPRTSTASSRSATRS